MSLFDRLLVRALPFVPRPIVGRVARRYIAGETLDEALAVAAELNRAGLLTTLDLLGEDTADREAARRRAADYAAVLEAIDRRGVDGNVSVKPTQFGLNVDARLCLELFRGLAAQAGARGAFVRVEMEQSAYTDATLELFGALRRDFGNVGTVIQACLHRSESDVRRLLADGRLNVRLVKGVYLEPETIAWSDRAAVRDNWVRLAEMLLREGAYVALATHDEWLVERSLALVERFGLARSDYEFQMLLGVREDLRDDLVRAGHRLRVYVPFGEDWRPYSLRRMRENPRVARYVWGALWRRRRSGRVNLGS